MTGPAERPPSTVVAEQPFVPCSNENEHGEDVPAIFDVSFPDGRWHRCTACRECFEIIVDNMLDDPTPVLFVPLRQSAAPAHTDPTGCDKHPVANGFCVHCLRVLRDRHSASSAPDGE